ncbi:MAG: ferrochelatase [Thaumarchaeota archaeon]|nr:ferrochelatase [Nitrososphaerota archaeon]
MTVNGRTCVVLMTYGSPATLDDVPGYLRRVRGGREPDEALVSEFRRRYRLIGGSPLLRITSEQAERLQLELDGLKDGCSYNVVSGMRFSPPLIADVLRQAAPEVGCVIGIIMSPQFSPIIMGGYVRTLQEAVSGLHRDGLALKMAEDWHLQPFFLEAVAQRVREALARFPGDVGEEVPVLFTAHSMPKRVIEKEPDYVRQLKETAAAVAELVGLQEGRWLFCYQSAGHTPEGWLKPDFADVMPELRNAGYNHVLIAPVQFLADHLEILYDIEIGARQQAELAGLKFARIESLNTSPLLIKALTAVVQQALARAP